MIQGVSWALFENRILDRNVGTMVNPNLEAYKVLSSKDMRRAHLDAIHRICPPRAS